VLPDQFIDKLSAAGVRVGTIDPRTVRFVTHKDVDDDDVARTVAALDGLRAG
jgi:threonine aldolase